MNYSEYLKAVGLNVITHLTPLRSTTYGATRVTQIAPKVEYVVLHTTGNKSATAKNEADNIFNNAGVNSFHGVADEVGFYETVRFKETAHHAGVEEANLSSLGFELSDHNPGSGYENYIKYIAWVMHQLGLVPSHATVRFHNEFVSTSCGSFLKNKGKDTIIADLNKYIAIAKGTGVVEPDHAVKPKPPVAQPAPKKQYINLKPVASHPRYGYYRKGVTPVFKNISGYLEALKLEGISYEIKGWVNPKVVLVNTRDFGTVQLFVDPLRATLTSKPTYKVYG